MNKVKLGLVLVFGSLLSLGAMAAEEGELTAGGSTTITTDPSATLGCSLLASGVRVNLSANVSAYYACDFANSDIRIGTCHAAGSRAEKTVSCTNVADTSTDASAFEFSDPDNCVTEGTDATFTDRSAFIATSTGGSVGEAALNGSLCNGGNLGSLSFFQ